MTPEQIAKSGTESAHQCALFAKAASELKHYPMLRWMHSIPNGGRRDLREAARLKAEGARAGVWDIFFPCPTLDWSGLYIEMKVGKNKLSELQEQFACDLADKYKFELCYSWQEAWAAIERYLG